MHPKTFIVCDTSVVINFLKINRLDLLEKYSPTFFITDHVQEEITTQYANQYHRLHEGLEKCIFHKVNVDDPKELDIFAKLGQTRQLGAGECAAIAVASHRDYKLAIDE